MIILIIHIIVSYDQNSLLIFYVKYVLCLLYRPETVHCSTKNTYTSYNSLDTIVVGFTKVLKTVFLVQWFIGSKQTNKYTLYILHFTLYIVHNNKIYILEGTHISLCTAMRERWARDTALKFLCFGQHIKELTTFIWTKR